MYYPYYWPDYGTLIDTFDAEDNFTPGHEHYDITEVVKDSLKSVNKNVRMVLKVRDETKSYNRMVNYRSDWDNAVQTDTIGQHDTTIAQWPKLTIVYEGAVSMSSMKSIKYSYDDKIEKIKVFNASGREIGTHEVSNMKMVENIVNKKPNGFYFVQVYTSTGVFTNKLHVLNNN